MCLKFEIEEDGKIKCEKRISVGQFMLGFIVYIVDFEVYFKENSYRLF